MLRFCLPAVLFSVVAAAPAFSVVRAPDGGGEFVYERQGPCLTEEMREEIQRDIDANIAVLEKEGKLLEETSKRTLFAWPLEPAPHYDDYSFWAISGYVDQDPTGGTEDWNCGTWTYDGHAGTDFYLWPFAWKMVDNEDVHVVAGARGVIVGKYDGNFDRSCDWVSHPSWNAIYVEHSDKSVAWYGHMKNGSLTAKGLGDTVEVGEYLGIVASSGVSTGPHMHLELHKRFGDLVDPYEGACNLLNQATWWETQPPYYNSAVNAVMTHSAPPVFPACPTTETLNKSDLFEPGETLITAVYLRDELSGQTKEMKIYEPDGTVWQSWSHPMPGVHYTSSWWYWNWVLPLDAPVGFWKFEVIFDGVTYEHTFAVGAVTSVDGAAPVAAARPRLEESVPNPFNPTTTISYLLPERTDVVVEIYSAGGALVKRLVDRSVDAGRREVVWNGENRSGEAVSSGVYFVRLAAGATTDFSKITLIR